MTIVADHAIDQRPVLLVSDSARSAISTLCRDRGRHAILLGWPTGVGYLPADSFAPRDCDVIIGHVAGCPVYVDLRDRAQLAAPRLVLEVAAGPPDRRTPVLRQRRSEAEFAMAVTNRV
ncbi:MAG: hypothetical protein ABI140_13385 [Jatrophihabitantaceae bacterium]